MRLHYDALAKKPLKPQHSTPGRFHYADDDNLLTFHPEP